MSLRRDLAGLSKELQLAAAAALALAFSLVLPWYQKSVPQPGRIVQSNVSALGVFTFVEAAILLVAVAVLFLVWARSQRKGFHLPGGDGIAITLAGGWAVLLLVWRMFDRPAVQGVGVDLGIQWGLFVALLCAGALVAAGARVRAAHRPEPPNPAADGIDWVNAPNRERSNRPDRRPRDPSAVTDVLRERPAWEGDPREPPLDSPHAPTTRPGDAPTTRLPGDRSEERTTRLPDDRSEERTTRLPDDRSEDQTSRLFDDPSRAETTRLPEDPSSAQTRRQRRPDDTPPLWEDDA
jgi:hypothetical protein